MIKLAQEGRLETADGTALDRSPSGIKRHMLEISWSRFETERNGILNGIDPQSPSCVWEPVANARLLRRQNDDAQCDRPTATLSPTETSSAQTVDTESAAPSVSSSVESAKAPATTFGTMTVQEPVCRNEADFPGHADVRERAVIDRAVDACARWSDAPGGKEETWPVDLLIKS